MAISADLSDGYGSTTAAACCELQPFSVTSLQLVYGL
jgi:hypothetical protein